MNISDLKTAYNVLCELDYPVPEELLVHMAQTIRTTEENRRRRKMARMSEEQLIHLQNKQKRIIRIYTSEGRLIQKSTARLTFREAIKTIGAEAVAALQLKVGRKPLILQDETMERKRIKGYFFLQPGYFLLDTSVAADKYKALCRLDQLLQLDWEIEWV